MSPSQLRDLLAVLRDAGVASADLYDGTDRIAVTFAVPGHAATADNSAPPAILAVDDNELPPGAFDPVARRRAAKAAT